MFLIWMISGTISNRAYEETKEATLWQCSDTILEPMQATSPVAMTIYSTSAMWRRARLGVSRSIYVNVGTPNLGFTYFNFLGGELKKPPCILLDHRAINTKFLVSRIVVRMTSKGFKIHCKGSNSSESVSDYIKFRYICIHYSMMFLHRKWMMSYQSVQFIC